MSGRKAITYAIACLAGVAAAVLHIPSLIIIGVFLATCLVGGVWFTFWPLALGKNAKMPTRSSSAPISCPKCGHTEHEYKLGGLWDGPLDPATGKRKGGGFGYGICKQCGCRWGQWDESPAYVASPEEWEREVGRYDPELLWARGHDPLLSLPMQRTF